MKVAIIMGSDSDYPVVKKTVQILEQFEIDTEIRILSTHRTPLKVIEFGQCAQKNGFDLIIAASGKAAHLPGALASITLLPVIGLPIKSPILDGIDSILSMVQTPKGIPVATVGIDSGENAGLLAVQMLSLKYNILKEKLEKYREEMEKDVLQKDREFRNL